VDETQRLHGSGASAALWKVISPFVLRREKSQVRRLSRLPVCCVVVMCVVRMLLFF